MNSARIEPQAFARALTQLGVTARRVFRHRSCPDVLVVFLKNGHAQTRLTEGTVQDIVAEMPGVSMVIPGVPSEAVLLVVMATSPDA